jgi:PEGA domain
MWTFNYRKSWRLLCLLGVVYACQGSAYAQGPCGGKPCPVVKVPGIRTTPPRSPRPRPTSPRDGSIPPVEKPVEVCEDADFVVVCGMPGCEITLEGRESARAKFRPLGKSITDDLGGFTFRVPGNQWYKINVSKPGYEQFPPDTRRVDCDDQQQLKAALRAKPVTLRIRTQPAESDIYLEREQQPAGKSDATGLFSYLLTKPTLLIEARKKGYLSDTKTVMLAPELASREIVLSLEPISATLQLTSNVQQASVTVDNQKTSRSVHEKIPLAPGRHNVSVEALGYTPASFEITVTPEEVVSKHITLERMPITSLRSQATTLFGRRAYDDVLKLAQFMLEADKTNGGPHLLIGLVHLERANFATAESHLDQALTGGETVSLQVRRHGGERFELSKGHDICDAKLILSKTELEFKSDRNPAENFKVPYAQVQIVGVQLKNRLALYLSTKVNVAGKRRDYNFYSYDRELSQAGKPYLEMIQRLIRSH